MIIVTCRKEVMNCFKILYKEIDIKVIFNISVNILSFITLSAVIFSKNIEYLFYGFDGHYLSMLIDKQMHSGEKTLGLGFNLLQSLGNVSYATNFWFIPAISLSFWLNEISLNSTILYSIFALELFSIALLLGRFSGLNWYASIVCAWLLPLLTMPYIGLPYFYHVTSLTPQITDAIAVSTLLIMIYSDIGKVNIYKSLLLFSLLILGVIYLFISYTSAVILIAPVFFIFSLFSTIQSVNRNELIVKFLAIIGLLLIIFFSGLSNYLIGLLEYTAAHFYPSELVMDRPPWFFTSVLFHKNISSIIVIFSFLGGIYDALYGLGQRKILARSFILIVSMLIIGGIYVNIFISSSPISLLYFEFFIWPFYIVFFVSLLSRVFNCIVSVSICNDKSSSLSCMLFFAPWLLFLMPTAPISNELVPTSPEKTPIMKVLSNEIELKSGNNFNGRVATFTGLSLPDNLDWAKLGYLDYLLRNEYKTEHRSLSLWFANIPTLWEYNAFITPAFYQFTKKFFSKDGDIQTRNVMVWREINLKMLSLLGVRFIVTDKAEESFKQRETVQMGSLGTHHLYEIVDTNLGQYSPVNAIKLNKLTDILNLMSLNEFDPKLSFITNTETPKKLTLATNVVLTINQQRIDITARSKSTSVLILPFEFSNCIKLIDKNTGLEIDKFRANGLLVGLSFNKNLDATLQFNINPFDTLGCRKLDAKDFIEMIKASPTNK